MLCKPTERIRVPLFFSLGFVLCLPTLRSQSLPFDHWLNPYWQHLQAFAPTDIRSHLTWPVERETVLSFLSEDSTGTNPTVPRGWMRFFRRAFRADRLGRISPRQWDRERLGMVAMSGTRLAAHDESPTLWIFGETAIHFRRNLLAFVRVRASPEPQGVPAFTAVPRAKRRLGFNSAEADYVYVDWHGDWWSARLGRFKEAWGAGDERSVWLNAWGPSYDGFRVALRYHGFELRFFSAYLETVVDSSGTQDVQRYLAGHMLSYTNGRNFVIGAGEVTLYAGPNRPMSLAYMNPFMSYLEYEDNLRVNSDRRRFNRDNWLMAVMGEWYPFPRVRLWGTWVIDDIQLDREKVPNATALKTGISYARRDRFHSAFRLDYVRISTWTYRHQEPYINFVSRDLPLGYDEGSDLEEVVLSVAGLPAAPLFARVELGYRRQGELDFRTDPYLLRKFTYGWPFPSGVVESARWLGLQVRYQPLYNLWVEAGFRWQSRRNANHLPGNTAARLGGFVRLSWFVDFSVYPP